MKITYNPKNIEDLIRERLKMVRIEMGFQTAKSFAEKNGLKISTYALHEAGTRSLSLTTIDNYAKLLSIQTNWLLTGLGPKFKLK